MKFLQKNKEFSQYIVYLSTEDQLYDKGVDIFGKSLRPYYSTNTIEGTKYYKGKKEKKQFYGHVTLKDTSIFYKSHKIVLLSNLDIQIIADDPNDLEKHYGEIVGLTDENYIKVIKLGQEILTRHVNEILAA